MEGVCTTGNEQTRFSAKEGFRNSLSGIFNFDICHLNVMLQYYNGEWFYCRIQGIGLESMK